MKVNLMTCIVFSSDALMNLSDKRAEAVDTIIGRYKGTGLALAIHQGSVQIYAFPSAEVARKVQDLLSKI
jgi:hypothetical protein